MMIGRPSSAQSLHWRQRRAIQLLDDAAHLGIMVWVRGEDLRVKTPREYDAGPRGERFRHLVSEMKALEPEIIEMMKAGHTGYVPDCLVCKMPKYQLKGRLPRCPKCDR